MLINPWEDVKIINPAGREMLIEKEEKLQFSISKNILS